MTDNKVLTIKEIKEKTKSVFIKYNIKEIYLFGSYARSEANNNSDIDFYIDKGNIKDLYQSMALKEELELSLNKKIDIVFIDSKINDFVKEQIEKEMINLYYI